MKKLLLLAIAGAVLISSTPAVSKKYKFKHKEKSFEPVASSEVGGYTGHYVGIQSKYWVDIKVDADNRIEVTLYEDGAQVALRDVELHGSRLEATKVLGEGTRVPFEATFGERRVNDDSAFGLLVEGDVYLDGDTRLNRLFYRRQSSTPGTAP